MHQVPDCLLPSSAGAKRVQVTNLAAALQKSWLEPEKHLATDAFHLEDGIAKKSKVNGFTNGCPQKKIAVLISGSGEL